MIRRPTMPARVLGLCCRHRTGAGSIRHLSEILLIGCPTATSAQILDLGANMADYIVKDISLAAYGRKELEYCRNRNSRA